MCKITMKTRHVDTNRVSKEFGWTTSSQNGEKTQQTHISPKKKPKQLLSVWSQAIMFVVPSSLELFPLPPFVPQYTVDDMACDSLAVEF